MGVRCDNIPPEYERFDESLVKRDGTVCKNFYLNLTQLQLEFLEVDGPVIHRLRVRKYSFVNEVSQYGFLVVPEETADNAIALWHDELSDTGAQMEICLGSFVHSDGKKYKVYRSGPFKKNY